jgi:hypothetical protein
MAWRNRWQWLTSMSQRVTLEFMLLVTILAEFSGAQSKDVNGATSDSFTCKCKRVSGPACAVVRSLLFRT